MSNKKTMREQYGDESVNEMLEYDLERELVKCEDCGVFTSNGDDHMCIPYDPEHLCPDCGAPSVYAHAGAPGIGGSWVCSNNHHYDSTVRTLEPWEVI